MVAQYPLVHGVVAGTAAPAELITDGLVMHLDAGDIASYSSGQKWQDVFGGTRYDWFRGNDGTVEASDPTFNGTPGNLSANEFWSFDGSQYFTYDSPNEPWMDNIHKNNASFTLEAWIFVPAGGIVGPNAASIIGNQGNNVANIGHLFRAFADERINFLVVNSSTVVCNQNSSGTINANAWNQVAVSLDEAGGAGASLFVINGSLDRAFNGTYTSPSAAGATYTTQLCAAGNNQVPFENNMRIAILRAYTRNLTENELRSNWGYNRERFSL